MQKSLQYLQICIKWNLRQNAEEYAISASLQQLIFGRNAEADPPPNPTNGYEYKFKKAPKTQIRIKMWRFVRGWFTIQGNLQNYQFFPTLYNLSASDTSPNLCVCLVS